MKVQDMKTIILFWSVAALSFAGSAFAGTAVLTKDDTSSSTCAFNGKTGYWNPDIVPTSSEGANTDYIVKDGRLLKTPNSSSAATFKGKSLTLGASDYSSIGKIGYRTAGGKVTIPNLIVYKGEIANNLGLDKYSTVNVSVGGNATLYTTDDSPFSFGYVGKENATSYFELVLTGDENTSIKLHSAKLADLKPRCDQSATYSGNWQFGADQTIYVDGNYKVNNASVFQTSRNVFGKALTVFNPKSISFENGCKLRYEATDKKLDATDNRGIYINADDGIFTFILYNGMVLDCGYPISGNPGAKVTTAGNGSLRMRAPSEAKLVMGSSSSLGLVGSAAANGGVEVLNNTVVTVGETATDRVSANGALMKNPMFKFFVAADGSNAAQLRLSGDLDLDGVIGLGFNQIPNVVATNDIPVLVIDKSVMREFTAEDFDPWGVAGAQIANADSVVVSRNVDGDQVVSVRVFPYVKSNAKADPGFSRMDTKADWNPSGWTVDGTTYVVWGQRFRTGSGYDDNKDVSVRGDFVLYNSGTSGSSYEIKPSVTRFDNVRLLDDAKMTPVATIASWTMELTGIGFDVRTTPGKSVTFVNNGMGGVIVSAPIRGRGTICASGVSSVDGRDWRPYLSFTGDNSAYVGKFFATNTSVGVNYCPLKAGAEKNFGGNPEVFSADAWKIGNGVVFVPTADITFDDANRGVTFMGGSSVDTTDGDFTVKTPVVFLAGTFAVTGTGTFAFGEGGVTVEAGTTLSVGAGATVKAESSNAFAGLMFDLADGALLAFDADKCPYDLSTSTINSVAGTPCVRIDGLSNGLVLAHCASAEAATALVASVKMIRGTGRKGQLVAHGADVKVVIHGLAVTLK